MFLANENFPRPGIIILREKGYPVKSISEDFPGIGDPEIMQLALDLKSIILTFDRDYGELIFRYTKDNPPAVVHFREKGNNPEFAASSLISLLENSGITLSGAFTVIETNNVRQRFYKNKRV
jgi:predicted nuclease of predicted toxin-antitoxin system